MMNKSYKLIALFPLILFSLTGCGSNSTSSVSGNVSSDGDNMALNLSIPKALAIVADSAMATLSPGDYSTTLTISGNTVSGTISGIPPGTYTLTITYNDTPTATTIATVTKENISVSAGSTTGVAVLESDLFTDIDDDIDGFSNLAEVRIGTDPNSNVDVPLGGSPAFLSGNSAFGNSSTTSYSFTITVGETVAGNYSTVANNSTNYIISAGFKGF